MIPYPEDQPTMSVDEAARACGLSRGSAYEAVKKGELPAQRIGSRWIVSTAGIRELLGMPVSKPVEATNPPKVVRRVRR